MKLYPNVAFYFSIWLISLLLISFIGFFTMPHSNVFSGNFFQSLSNWDGGHFLGIAEHGYSEKFQYAFFPLYPLLTGFLGRITKDYLLAGDLISVTASFFGMQFLYKLVELDFDKEKAKKVILLLVCFPTSFFFLTVYSEGLFFFLVVATFYFLRTKKLLWATILASLASATRLAGLALVIALFIEVFKSGVNRRNAFVLLAPLGFLIYCWYLYTRIGDPFYFLVAQNHWQRSLVLPGMNFLDSIKNLKFRDLLFAIFGVGLALRSFRFLPLSYSIYALVSLLLPLSTPSLESMPRYLLPIFPLFILVAIIKNKHTISAYQMISLVLLCLFIVLFVNGYWVA